MKRKFYSMFLLFILVFSLTGCAKVVHAETKAVEATVIDIYYKPAWVQPMVINKTTTMITHPAQYRVTLEYEGETYNLHSYSDYNYCEDLEGEKVTCAFEIIEYDNGTMREYISGLWKEE